jgi:tRNA(Leu) C34 or U34 (ribose-2'-O)-methylase TrmL
MIYGFIMIFVLVKLSRFVTPKEQEILIQEMGLMLRNYSKKVKVKDDPWGTRYRILISISENIVLTKGLINTILSNPGVNNLIVFQQNLFDTRSDTLSQLMKTTLEFISSKTHSNTINVNFHALGRVPFHKKAILDRLKKKDIINDPKADFKLYIEVRQVQGKHLGEKGVLIRIGEKIVRQTKQPSSHIQTPKLVLFSPYTIQEVADFFRLALTFNTQVLITDENNKAEEIIQDVEKTYFKGIDKINFKIESSLDSLMDKKSKCKFYGFSLWGKSPITELNAEIKRNTPLYKETLFLFGNEETGLPLWVRDKIIIFHIGKKVSEPLRASQAAAYAFGMMRI